MRPWVRLGRVRCVASDRVSISCWRGGACVFLFEWVGFA